MKHSYLILLSATFLVAPQIAQGQVAGPAAAFEAAVQKWVDATGELVAEQNDIFVARAEAQLEARQYMIDQLEASAKDFASDRKREIDSAVATIRVDAEVTKTKLEALKRSAKESWTALTKALAKSRAA